MKKKATIYINSNDLSEIFETEIEIKNNKINYKEQDSNTTNVLFDIENKILIRENKELYMEYDFLNNKGSIYIKNLQKNIDIEIKTLKIEINNSIIEIIYQIEKEKYHYKIEMEA